MEQIIRIYEPAFAELMATYTGQIGSQYMASVGFHGEHTDSQLESIGQQILEEAWFHGNWPEDQNLIPQKLHIPIFVEYRASRENFGLPMLPFNTEQITPAYPTTEYTSSLNKCLSDAAAKASPFLAKRNVIPTVEFLDAFKPTGNDSEPWELKSYQEMKEDADQGATAELLDHIEDVQNNSRKKDIDEPI